MASNDVAVTVSRHRLPSTFQNCELDCAARCAENQLVPPRAVSAQLSVALTQLTNQVTQSTALLDANLKQVMRENLTPDQKKVIQPSILTCSGTDCPNVLANCPKGACSWNNVGP